MSAQLTNHVQRYSLLFERGGLTAHEFANKLFGLYAQLNASEEDISSSFKFVPAGVMNTLQAELHELANADFYRQTTGAGDTRTEDELHKDTMSRQPALRKVCRVLTPLVLARIGR